MTPSGPNDDNNDFQSYPIGGPGHQYRPEPDAEWNPYQASWTDPVPAISTSESQAVSALSILSMISGLLSVPLMCLCFFSLPFSLFAIVSGHISRSICRRSQGRVTGDGMAIAGLVLGYMSFIITAGLLAYWGIAFSSAPTFIPPPVMPAPPVLTAAEPAAELDQAVAMLSLSLSSGRTPEATELAQHLQASLHDLARQLATEGSSGAETPDAVIEQPPAISDTVAELPEQSASSVLQKGLSECGVFCELHEDSCAFLIHIQSLSELSEADTTQLSRLVWLAAGRTVDGNRDEGCELAIGFVSIGTLGQVSMGHYERSDQFDAGLQYRGPAVDSEKRNAFAKFFATPTTVEEPQESSIDAAEMMPE